MKMIFKNAALAVCIIATAAQAEGIYTSGSPCPPSADYTEPPGVTISPEEEYGLPPQKHQTTIELKLPLDSYVHTEHYNADLSESEIHVGTAEIHDSEPPKFSILGNDHNLTSEDPSGCREK